MSRGLDETEAYSLIVNGFIEPITKELPMEYTVELNRLIQLEKSSRVGIHAKRLKAGWDHSYLLRVLDGVN